MAVSRLSKQSLQNAFPKGNTVWDGTTSTSAFDSLGVVVLSADTPTITFSNIPQTYTHLQLRCFTRDARSSSNANNFFAYVNGDTTYTNYYYHSIFGNGTSVAGTNEQATGTRCLFLGTGPSSSAAANTYGSSVVDILDYTNTSKYTVARSLTGCDNNSSGTPGEMRFASSVWLNTAAVTSLTINNYGSNNFVTYSSFALYGVK
jgi:hypothetical protein